MYRLIIAGGRDFNDFTLAEKEIKEFLKGKRPSEIEVISGGAKGADSVGERFARKYKCKLTKMPAEWKKYGNKSAGVIRNREMAVLCIGS